MHVFNKYLKEHCRKPTHSRLIFLLIVKILSFLLVLFFTPQVDMFRFENILFILATLTFEFAHTTGFLHHKSPDFLGEISDNEMKSAVSSQDEL